MSNPELTANLLLTLRGGRRIHDAASNFDALASVPELCQTVTGTATTFELTKAGQDILKGVPDKRLAPLPTAVRQSFQPAYHSAGSNTPEDSLSKACLRDMGDEAVAAIDPDKISYYRGRGKSRGSEGSDVFVLAVYNGKVIATEGGVYYWYSDPKTTARELERRQVEEERRTKLSDRINRWRGQAIDKIAKAKYDALPSTRLAVIDRTIEELTEELAQAQAKRDEILAETL